MCYWRYYYAFSSCAAAHAGLRIQTTNAHVDLLPFGQRHRLDMLYTGEARDVP